MPLSPTGQIILSILIGSNLPCHLLFYKMLCYALRTMNRESSAIQEQQEQRLAALYQWLAAVPGGCVASYGQLARLAGLGNGARWVGRQLSRLPESTKLPWHRVISASGHISLPPDTLVGQLQRQLLREEGVLEIGKERVDMRRFGWPCNGPHT